MADLRNAIMIFFTTLKKRSLKYVKLVTPLIFIGGLIIFLFYTVIDIVQKDGSLVNAPNYLNITTYDGSGQSVHPDVIYTSTAWCGYHYIMAYTPYPFENDDYENPSIRGSNDGINWYKFEGQTDPIVSAPPDISAGGHNADPNIILDGSELTLFYLKGDGTTEGCLIKYTTSTDPTIWTVPEQTDLPAILSPSFYKNGTTWECWGIDYSTHLLRRFTSLNKINWTECDNVSCTIPGYITWHANVKKIDNSYQALIVGYQDLSSGKRSKYLLFRIESNDGIAWKLMGDNPILRPSSSGWDNCNIYASTLLKVENIYKIWYSAQSEENQWHIGYIEF